MADSQPDSNVPLANSQPDSKVPVADSQPNSNIFSVRIVSIDYYMAPPIPDLDICYSRFQGGKVNEVPVIRIYGSTPVGQKTCLHIHRVLPYLYVPCTDIPFQPDQEGDAYTNAISLAIEKALKLKGTASSKRQHVHGCSLVRAKRFYGYHSSEELFIKIYLYYPHDVSRAANLLLGGEVLDKSLQPHESHIPYTLQFLIDYNLYGMGHLHLSKVKFRQPVPDVFSPMKFSYNWQYRQKMDKLTGVSANFQADSSGDAYLGSQVWISSTIPRDWMWQFSNEFDTSSDQGIHCVKRQSVCELEGDVTIDEVINQHLKMYTSLSQTRSDVKMVQSLIPIWEEEYERTGMHESAIPPDPSKPVPEDVLKTLLLDLESKNNFMELCGEAVTNRTLILSDSDMKFVQAITYSTDEENSAELGNAKNIDGESLKCSKEREIIGSLSPAGSVYEKEIEAIPFDGKDACLKLLSGDEIRSSEMIETVNRKPADEEALGLLRWFATTQAADDINSDDELVCETILSPLLPATTIEKVLEKANVDYENESQKECQDILDSNEECQDILDSNEDLIDFEGLRERASRSTDHGCHPQTSSERKIPQVDGSCDDPYSSPSAGPVGNSSNIKMKSESKRHEKQVLHGSSFTSKQRRNKSGWGSLPFCMTQRENDDLQIVRCDITGAGATDSEDHVGMSFSAGSKVGKCSDALTMNAEKDFCDLKETGMLVGCSVRDLMRRKRCHRVEPPECGSHRVKKIHLDWEERDDVFLGPKRLDFNSLYNDGHDMKAFGSFTGQQVEHHEACDVKPVNYGCTMNNRLALSLSNDSSLQASALSVENICSFEKIDDEVGLGAIARSANFKIMSPRSVHREQKRLICTFNSERQDSAVPMDRCGTLNGEGSDTGATYVKTRTSDLCTFKSNSKFDTRLLKFDAEGKPLADEKLPQTNSAASSCFSTYPHEGEMFAGDGCLHKCGHKDRTSMGRVHEMSNENLMGTVTTTDTTVLQNNDCGGGEQGGDIGLRRSPSMVVNMEAKPADLIGMTLCKKPSASDWKDGQSKNISHLPAIFNCHSLVNEENWEGKTLDEILPFFVDACQEDKEVLKNCLRNSDSDFHQEDIMGVPTHYQNDGSYLYLLTPVFSPPSADCVNRWLLHNNEGTSGEISRASAEPPFLKGSFNQVHQENDGNPNATYRGEVKAILQGEGKPTRVITCTDCTHDISQISGPDEKSRSTPLSQIGFRDPASVGGGQQLTLLSIEVQVGSRENLQPDPRFDAINVVALAVQNDIDSIVEVYVLLRSSTESNQRSLDGISSFKLFIFSEEKHLFSHFVNIVYSLDPDILMGWDIQGGSLGFLAERASHLGIGLLNKISRTPLDTKIAAGDSEIADEGMPDNILPEHLVSGSVLIENAIIEDEWGRTHASGVHVGGRVVLNIWRLMRGEVKLNMYTVEAVAEAVLRRKVPSIHFKVLTNWFSSGPGRARYRCIEYVIERAKLNLEIMNQLDMINRTSELARVFGIDFFSVLSRGSQYRVESMFLRLAHSQNYLAISPGNQQLSVASQPAMECLPLVMEPESGFYSDPVVVLDFQSLYPSMIIAYNLCFCTCLGNVAPSKANTLGVLSFSPEPHFLRNLKDQILLTPNGVMYVPSKIRKGILPRLLEEILSTRVMVKQAMKKLAPSQQVLHRIFNARQLALKLIANVTYGYTAAGFSGRMPCAELADSIVQCGRSTLERAISFVNANEKWKAKVIYGDTDSMFVLLKGRTVKESFQIGHEIASAITAMNPNPVTLKMEKVYHPCFLLTKKRYVGYSYEGPDQIEPVFDAKGIETVRRDTCRAVAKTMEQSLRLFFKHQNLFEIKTYLQRQWTRILSSKVSVQDFVFAKEVRLGTYLTKSSSSLPPAAIVAAKAMRADPRAEPRYAERVPYVVIHGEPGARLVDMVVDPLDLLAIDSPFRLNDLYYINKQIIPALQRVFGLVGADLNRWFSEMPRQVREAFAKLPSYAPNPQRARIDFYYLSKHCIVCGELVQSSAHLCNKCSHKGIVTAAAVIGRTSKLEREMQHLSAICRHCGGGDWLVESGVKCTSLACSVFYERRKVQKELQGLSAVAADAGFYPKCMVEWF